VLPLTTALFRLTKLHVPALSFGFFLSNLQRLCYFVRPSSVSGSCVAPILHLHGIASGKGTGYLLSRAVLQLESRHARMVWTWLAMDYRHLNNLVLRDAASKILFGVPLGECHHGGGSLAIIERPFLSRRNQMHPDSYISHLEVNTNTSCLVGTSITP
jgi:hypothetical protein